jgi:hypothetical protein
MKAMTQDLETFVRLLSQGKYTNKEARLRFRSLCDFYPVDFDTRFKIENLIKDFTVKF